MTTAKDFADGVKRMAAEREARRVVRMVDGKALVAAARANGGFTVSLTGAPDPVDGIGVSLPGNEERGSLDLSDERLGQWVERYATVHEAALTAMRGNRYLGGWVEDGRLVLDVTGVFEDLSVALILARQWGQRSVYNFETREVIEVPAERVESSIE